MHSETAAQQPCRGVTSPMRAVSKLPYILTCFGNFVNGFSKIFILRHIFVDFNQ